MKGIGESIIEEAKGTRSEISEEVLPGDPAFHAMPEASMGAEGDDQRPLEEGGGMGPTTLTVGKFFDKDKYRGALMMDVQGDMTLGMFYDGLMRYAKKLGIPTVPIEKVTGSFNYGASKSTYLFFEIGYDDEQDVMETMKKASSSRVKVVILSDEFMSKEVVDAAKEAKAEIRKKAKPGSLEW